MPEMYRYRNYVIRSLQEDKPFDQFLREQIAGDLMPLKDDEDRAEKLDGDRLRRELAAFRPDGVASSI